MKYIKWTLGLDFNTPTHIVMEETKTDKIRVEAGRRAVRYEEKGRTRGINGIIVEFWKEIDRQKKRSRWEEERIKYYEGKEINRKKVSIRCTGDLRLAETLAQADREDQLQEQYDRTVTGKYNRRYREIRESEREEYLKAEYKGRDQVMIARFRCGNEELENKYWKEDEDWICRICKEERVREIARCPTPKTPRLRFGLFHLFSKIQLFSD